MNTDSDRNWSTTPPRNLSQHTARELGLKIVRGDWRPGDTLPDEPALCALYDVSRTVVREAIKMLMSKGLVEVRPRRGTTVQPRKRWQMLDAELLEWQQHTLPSMDTLLQLVEVRKIIEPEVAALAAERADLEACDRIKAAIAGMWDAVGSTDNYAAADAAFHAAVLSAAQNEYLDALEPVIFAGLRTSIRVTNPVPETNESSVKLHEAVGEAIVQRDPNAAREAMRALLADAEQRIDKFR